jgi:hypothetical protein
MHLKLTDHKKNLLSCVKLINLLILDILMQFIVTQKQGVLKIRYYLPVAHYRTH